MRTTIKTLIVKLRMKYADWRGHHGKRWNYEPGDWYMGRHKKIKKEQEPTLRHTIFGVVFILLAILSLSIILNILQGGI